MNNKNNSLFGKIFKIFEEVALVLCCVQGVYALGTCQGTAYVRVPKTWPDVYVYGTPSGATQVPASAYDASSGYYIIDLGSLMKDELYGYFEVFTSQEGTSVDYPGVLGINAVSYNQIITGKPNAPSSGPLGIPCPGIGASVYVAENPKKTGETYVGSVPPVTKYFHVLVPDNADWLSDQVMINVNGTKDTTMAPNPNLCGWVTMVFEDAPSSVYLYKKHDPDFQLGLGGLSDAEAGMPAKSIDLKTFYEAYGVDELYFIPDEEDRPDAGSSGWYIADPGVPEWGDFSRCSFSLAALIYDTDQSVNPLFSSDGEPDFYGAAKGYASGCIGVHHGIVDVNLGPDGKPKFSGSANAIKCFGNEANFNTLFNYTPGKNEVQCYDLPFRHYGTDSRWGYDSDSSVTNGMVGGFSPIEETTDMGVVSANGVTMGPLAVARTKRAAEGPASILPGAFPIGKIQDFDHYCNTPGWTGGVDCEGKFDNGENPADFWCWGSYCNANFKRWGDGSADLPLTKNEKRNQHFCFQSHATFVYHEDQEFTFRGDDDIWVFINKKLAVDNGGAHLAAPGHVVLKNLNTTYGSDFLIEGSAYDLDIFFCDRRTPISNVIIKTNMYIQQTSGISFRKTADYTPASPSYEMCYEITGDGSCAAAVGGSSDMIRCCGSDFATKPECAAVQIHYYLVNGSRLNYDKSNGIALMNSMNEYGFDLSNPAQPVIHKEKLTLGPGKWTLWSEIDGKTKLVYTYRSSAKVDVVYGDAIALDTNGNVCAKGLCGSIEKPNFKVSKEAVGGELVPIYVTATQESDGQLQLFPHDAQNLGYSLEYSSVMEAYTKHGDVLTKMQPGEVRSFGPEGGVDTIYVTVPLENLTKPIESFSIGVAGSSNKLSIDFAVPLIAFASSNDPLNWQVVSGTDPNDLFDSYWAGTFYDFYIAVLKPDGNGSYKLCEECNFPLSLGSETSEGISLNSAEESVFENGFATISLRCTGLVCSNYDSESPATIVINGGSPLVSAAYYPICFRNPPVAFPLFADVFDVRGKPLEKSVHITETYQADEYLDGIADSVVIYYDRRLHKDSLPDAICISWDTSSAKKINPYKEGFSTIPKDSLLPFYCNEFVEKDGYYKCLNVDKDGYCDNRLEIAHLKLSDSIKTFGSGEIYSFTSFSDKNKLVKQGFRAPIVDRIAPVVLAAGISSKDSVSGTERLTVFLSEPIKVNEEIKESYFDFIINSVKKLDDSLRLVSAVYGSKKKLKEASLPVVSLMKSGKSRVDITYNEKDNDFIPQEDDAVRLAGDLKNKIWVDLSKVSSNGEDDVRVSADTAYYWNSPTGYKETKRLPSPWVTIGNLMFEELIKTEVPKTDASDGDEKNDGGNEDGNVDENSPEQQQTPPSFRVKMVGFFKFAIVFEDDVKNKPRFYTLYNIEGAAVKRGVIYSAETIVAAPSRGTFIVRAGLHSELVKFK